MALSIKTNKPIFVSACEPSCDLYAALFLKNLKAQGITNKIVGIGGPRMAETGIDIVEDYHNLMTFGFSIGFGTIKNNYSIYKKISRFMYRIKPGIFLAVAYPGINLLLCQYARNLGAKVYYILPPQIWAWADFRKYFVKKWVDTVISLFPFEYDFYRKIGIKVVYQENPLIKYLQNYRRTDSKMRIGFMPGSRPGMVCRNMPVIIDIACKLKNILPSIELNLILLESFNKTLVPLPNPCPLSINQPHTSDRYQAMRNCDLLVICSGTASLEAAFMNIPQIFFHRPSFFEYHILRHFLKIKEYNLANLYYHSRKPLVPTFITYNKKKLGQNVYAKTVSFFP